MIKESSFTGTLPVASALALTGNTAIAKPGTVLSDLVTLSAPIETMGADGKPVITTKEQEAIAAGQSDLEFIGWRVQYATEGTLTDPTTHSRSMDAYIHDIAKAVTAHVAFAKNTVRPLVTEFAEAYQSYRASFEPKEAADSANIRVLRLPSVLSDESFLDTFTAFKGKPILKPDTGFCLGAKTTEELQQMILIGHQRTDKMISEWVSHLPESFLFNVWTSFFCASGVATPTGEVPVAVNYEEIARLNAFDKADVALAITLISRKLEDNVESTNLSLERYRTIASQYVEYGRTVLLSALESIAMMIRNGTLIVDKNVKTMTVSVNAEVYKPWLESGGTPEVLFGLLVDDASAFSVALIDDNKDKYAKRWEQYSAFYRNRELGNSFTYAKNFLEQQFINAMQTLTESEQEIVVKQPNLIEANVTKVREYLASVRPQDIGDSYDVALQLVAKIRFSYTSSYQILSDIVQASGYNPNVDVREAALLAVINYVSDYMADQIALG